MGIFAFPGQSPDRIAPPRTTSHIEEEVGAPCTPRCAAAVEALGTGGAAVSGLDEVIATLEHEAVDVLLVVEGVELVGGRCPRCGRLSASAEGACQADGSPLTAVDAIEHVVVVRHETAALRDHGSIAALLRW